MAYSIEDFPFETDQPQIEVNLPVGTHVLELVVEDSAGLRSQPDTVIVTVEREEIPDAEITAIEPTSGLRGRSLGLLIGGTGLADATAVTFYRQVDITRPTLPTRTLPTLPTLPTRLSIPDSTITAEITDRSDQGIRVRVDIASTSPTGTRTFSVTTPAGTIRARDLVFTVRGIITPTITRPTITRPTITRPTLTVPTITRPTLTVPTLTRPTLTIPTVTRPTLTRPTLTIPTVTRPTLTTPTVTRPTLTIPTVTRPTLTVPTLTRPTLTTPTLTRPTLTRPTVVLTTPIMREGLTLTSVRGVGAATAEKLSANGIGTVEGLAGSHAKDVAEILGYQDITRAQALIDNAAELLG